MMLSADETSSDVAIGHAPLSPDKFIVDMSRQELFCVFPTSHLLVAIESKLPDSFLSKTGN